MKSLFIALRWCARTCVFLCACVCVFVLILLSFLYSLLVQPFLFSRFAVYCLKSVREIVFLLRFFPVHNIYKEWFHFIRFWLTSKTHLRVSERGRFLGLASLQLCSSSSTDTHTHTRLSAKPSITLYYLFCLVQHRHRCFIVRVPRCIAGVYVLLCCSPSIAVLQARGA